MQRVALIVKYFPHNGRISGLTSYVSLLADQLGSIYDLHIFSQCSLVQAKKESSEKSYSLHSVEKFFWFNVPGIVKNKFHKVIVISGVSNPLFFYLVFKKLISELNNSDIYFYQGTVLKKLPGKLGCKLLKKCKKVITANRDLSQKLSTHLNIDCKYLPPGIDLEYINNLKAKKKNKHIRIGYLNHFNKIKGVDIALKAFSKLPFNDTEYILAGVGQLEKKMKKKYLHYENINFLGYVPDIISEIKACDIIILPFRSDVSVLGISQTVLETMAAGVPVIGSSVNVITSVISNKKQGLIFSSFENLLECITKLHDESDTREKLGNNARKMVQKYDIALIANKLSNILNEEQEMTFTQEKKTQNYYNDYSKIYEEERRQGYYSLINNLEFEKIEFSAKEKKTLEIGCGTGLILERTHKIARHATGIDISEGMLNVCQKKGLDVLQASATQLPFEDNTFDLVYSFKVLAHIPNIKKALQEIARVTKADGKMVLEFYNPYSFKGLNDKIRAAIKLEEPVYIRHDCLRSIKRYLPDNASIKSIRSARIWGPFATCYTLPVISTFFKFLDRVSCDSFLNRFGGYFMVEIEFSKQVMVSRL